MSATYKIATHLTPTHIRAWGEGSSKMQRKVPGKPSGFWYSYGDIWLEHYYSKNVECVDLWRYDFKLPVSAFTKNIDEPGKNKIIVLSSDNFDRFIAKYHESEFMVSDYDIISRDMYTYFTEGESYLTSYADINNMNKNNNNNNNNNNKNNNTNDNTNDMDFKEYIADVILMIKDEMEKYNDPDELNMVDFLKENLDADMVPKMANKILELQGKTSLRIGNYDWIDFWKKVSYSWGGVEFSDRLAKARGLATKKVTLKGGIIIDVSWLRLVEVESGCLFDPLAFFGTERPKETFIKCPSSVAPIAPKRRNNIYRRTLKISTRPRIKRSRTRRSFSRRV